MKGVQQVQRLREFILVTSILYSGFALYVLYGVTMGSDQSEGMLLMLFGFYCVIAIVSIFLLYRNKYLEKKSRLYGYLVFSGIFGNWLTYNELGKVVKKRQAGVSKDFKD